MKKIISILVLAFIMSFALFSSVSMAAFLVLPSSYPCDTECQEKRAETERLAKEKLEKEARARLLLEQQKVQEEQQIKLEKERAIQAEKTEALRKENEYKAKIQELETRVNKLESQKVIVKTPAVVPTVISTTPTVVCPSGMEYSRTTGTCESDSQVIKDNTSIPTVTCPVAMTYSRTTGTCVNDSGAIKNKQPAPVNNPVLKNTPEKQNEVVVEKPVIAPVAAEYVELPPKKVNWIKKLFSWFRK